MPREALLARTDEARSSHSSSLDRLRPHYPLVRIDEHALGMDDFVVLATTLFSRRSVRPILFFTPLPRFVTLSNSLSLYSTRYILSGLWAGIAVGRIALTAVFDKRLGERTFTILTLACASAALAILYVRSWAVDAGASSRFLLLPRLTSSRSPPQSLFLPVAMFLSGIFIGPVTPRVLSTVAIRVPPSLKGSTMSLTIGLGASSFLSLFIPSPF